MLMASFALLVLGKTRAQLDGGVKYVVINLISTLLFLTGLGLVYGMTGTLNMAHLHIKLRMVSDPGLVACRGRAFFHRLSVSSPGSFLCSFGCRHPITRRRWPRRPSLPVC
jgi:multicomponent Na+:H+ antiporter subunit D